MAPVLLVWAASSELKDQLRQLEIGADRLVLRSFTKEWSLLRDEVDSISLEVHNGVRSSQRLDVRVLLRDGEVSWITPAGVDAHELFDALQEWHPDAIL